MFVKVDKPKEFSGGDNKGSSYNFLSYLEKENEGKSEEEKQRFFTNDEEGLYKNQIMDLIDNNHKNLGDKDTKFYTLSINPTHKEQQSILKHIGIDHKISNLNELTPDERSAFEKELKEYTRDVMNLYAANFNRGLTGNDIKYGSKIEHSRTYKHDDINVRHNRQIDKYGRLLDSKDRQERKHAKAMLKELGRYKKDYEGRIIREGQTKSGLNSHIHVIVGRNTKELLQEDGTTKPMKISPMAKPRYNSEHKVGDTTCKIGFDHEAWKEVSAELFNEKYSHKSQENELYSDKVKMHANKSGFEIHKQTKKALQSAKYHILRGTFKTEEKVLKSVLTPNKVIHAELQKINVVNNIKNNIKDILLGKIFEK